MAAHPPESTVMVRPFVRRREGNDAIVGDPERGVFLAIPFEALDILDSLAAGDTVGEAAQRFESKHKISPDIDAFLDMLIAEDFIRPRDDVSEPMPDWHQHSHGSRRGRHVRLDWISPAVARKLTSAPALVLYLAVVAVGVGLWLNDPDVLPSPGVLLYPNGDFTVLVSVGLAIMLVGTFIHELAHATVARANGVPVTLAISNLMYFIVAQTDISGMRMAPKRQLYLAFVAGSLADLVTASLLLCTLYADRHGMIVLPPSMRDLVGAILLGYLFRLLFQTFFYLRTDLYYLIATAFKCRNLMSDTERLLKLGLLRLVGKRPVPFGLARLPLRERLAISTYMMLYVIGRVYSVLILIVIFLPITVNIVVQFLTYRAGQDTHLGLVDFLLIMVFTLVFNGAGVMMWVRGLYRHIRPGKASDEPGRKTPAAIT